MSRSVGIGDTTVLEDERHKQGLVKGAGSESSHSDGAPYVAGVIKKNKSGSRSGRSLLIW